MKLFMILFSRMRPAIETTHAQSCEIKNFAFRGALLILENSENFMPRKFLAIRYLHHTPSMAYEQCIGLQVCDKSSCTFPLVIAW